MLKRAFATAIAAAQPGQARSEPQAQAQEHAAGPEMKVQGVDLDHRVPQFHILLPGAHSTIIDNATSPILPRGVNGGVAASSGGMDQASAR
jgi:hypothetical protein